jgi:translation initiation factor 2 subunit 2
MDYDASLDRAMDALPERSSAGERLSLPDAQTQPDGAFTRLTNLDGIGDTVSRDPEHVHSFVQRALGTAGKFEDGVGRYNGRFSGSDFDEVLTDYMEEYVLCSECGLPDTRLVRENRTPMLRCDACGAFRPVAKRNRNTSRQRDQVKKGESYTVEITGTGRKGDGVAERGEYTIFVPGASEGDVVDIYVENVSGELAFARKD